jgi:hypothetical protein
MVPGVMQRSSKYLFAALGSVLLLAASGVGWYAFSSPPVENLPLPQGLIGIA